MKETILVLLLWTFLLGACSQAVEEKKGNTPVRLIEVAFDLPDIRERGKLIAIMQYNPTSYFLYRGQPMGFEYELLQKLTKQLQLELEIRISNDFSEAFRMLSEGEGDIIAHGLTVTKHRKEKFAFTEHYTTTRQVLVQRKPDQWRQMHPVKVEKALIRNQIELIGKEVYVHENSAYYSRLLNLSEEIGGDILIKTLRGELETSELVRKVANREIPYTVADQNIAEINRTFYTNLDTKTPVSFPQRQAWAVRKSSPQLLDTLNSLIVGLRGKLEFNVTYNKYFKNRRAFSQRIQSEYFSKSGSKVSPYDPLLKQYAHQLGWDWRLLASMVYQESRFDPKANSWAGASGLMQLMPETAAHYGVTDLTNPEESIKAGVNYLNDLETLWQEVPDSVERVKFVLASYNVGPGHIQDARRLAEKHENDPNTWTNEVDQWVRQKSKKKYYLDESVKFGYCRGEEPFRYVKEIFNRYEQYQNLIAKE
ncbi:transporter substrate-binding domain-containing protein [Rapidithrix thailandica]|uniref:Transporter substrate-binding domain-containing protein n=1 Tax=Rapidithrix thailandica TaxID=413964 RepID=A0AAW9RZU8_9BACT